MIKKTFYALCLSSCLLLFGCKISGTISDSGTPFEGVTVTLSGPTEETAVTNSEGQYSFDELSEGIYSVTPSMAGYSFNPASREVTIDSEDETTGIDFEVVHDPQQCIVGPYLQTATPTSIKVMWETSVPGDSWVEWGQTVTLGSRTNSYEDIANKDIGIVEEYKDIFPTEYLNSVIHHAELTGLSPDTLYYYKVVSEDNNLSETNSFQTPPLEDSEKSFSFIVYGDNQGSPDQHSQNIDAMISYIESGL